MNTSTIHIAPSPGTLLAADDGQSRTIRIDSDRRVVVRGPRHWRVGSSERYGVNVWAERYSSEYGIWTGDAETLWGTERYDSAARNRIGLLGAYCDVAPSADAIDAAIRGALSTLGAPEHRFVPSAEYRHPVARTAEQLAAYPVQS